MNESDFWDKIRTNLHIDFLKRVENSVDVGWPDIHYMHQTYSGWIEIKCEEKLPIRIDFEPAQPLWHDNYTRIGGDSWVWLYTVGDKAIRIWQGSQAMELNKKGGAKFTEPFLIVKDTPAGWKTIYTEIFTPGDNVDKPL